jgi:RNase P/RNase MRP subunit p29
MKKQSICIFIIIVLLKNLQCFGQNVPDSTRAVKVETIDGNIFVGYVITEDSSTLVLKTENLGNLKIPLNNIKSKTELKEVKKVGNAFWLPNPQSSRYFWAPNGYGLEEGSSYYQNIWILYNQFSVGLTDNFSMGAGMLPLFLFGGASTPIWIVPKLSIPVVENKFNVGTGAFLGTIIGEQTGVFGLLYGTSTFGSRDKNTSFGLAYGFADGEWMKVPIINISCLIRTGPKGYFVSENYVITFEGETVTLISIGGRSIIRNIGLDYSLWIPMGAVVDNFVAIPFLGVTIPIGRKK